VQQGRLLLVFFDHFLPLFFELSRVSLSRPPGLLEVRLVVTLCLFFPPLQVGLTLHFNLFKLEIVLENINWDSEVADLIL